MKKNDIKDLKMKLPAELQRMLGDTREKLRSLRFDLAAGKIKNVSEIHAVRKLIARILTILNSAEKIQV